MITLTNDFHDTAVRLRPKAGRLSAGQIARAKRELCGIPGCTCSDDMGRRGPQAVQVEIIYTQPLTAEVIR